MNLGILANNDETIPIRIAIMSGPTTLGFRNTTVYDLKQNKTLDLNAQGGGQISMENFSVMERPSFVDYLRSGWQISLSVAIDFTGSNGHPSQPSSLHYLGPNNQYEAAIV